MFSDPVTILIIDDNSSFILSILRSFADIPNVNIDVLITSLLSPFYFRHSKYIRKLYHTVLTEENFESSVRNYAQQSGADLVIPTREWISKQLYLNKTELEKVVRIHPVSDPETLDTLTDKLKLNSWLERNNYAFTKVMPFSKNSNVDEIAANFSFPLLIKPSVEHGGGLGIRLITGKEQLVPMLSDPEIEKNAYFVQEYIEGYDIGINVYALDGKILVHTIQRGLFTGQFTYSRGTQYLRNPGLLELTVKIIGKLGYSGVANLDFRVDTINNRFVLVDFNGRYWSTLDGSRFMGVNFPVIVSGHTLGYDFSFPDYTEGTYYCTKAAVKTFFRNFFPGKKYPINLLHTKIVVILKDPMPELMHGLENTFILIKRIFLPGRAKSA